MGDGHTDAEGATWGTGQGLPPPGPHCRRPDVFPLRSSWTDCHHNTVSVISSIEFGKERALSESSSGGKAAP